MERRSKESLEERNKDSFSKPASESSITNFYHGRSIFITGGTGFMGKVLVEKLLRSCPGIVKIYLLMRPKKGQDVRQRLSDLFGAKLFGNLKQDNPHMLKKVVAVKGDIMEPALGLSQSKLARLADEVSVVVHSAATVRFDEPLRVAVEMNVVGTKRVMEICRKMTKLVSVVHISTAYSNCDIEEVSEEVYPLTMKPQQLIDLSGWTDNEAVKAITPIIIGARPNTYTYTKAMAEYMLAEEYADLPIAIVRPSIVTSSWKEPIPGWIDSYNGLTGMFVAMGKGLVRLTPSQSEYTADVIPVDVVINLIIAVGWYTVAYRYDRMLVYNCTSGSKNPMTWDDISRYIYPQFLKNPLNKMFWYPTINLERNRLLVKLGIVVDHYMPAYILDLMAMLSGRKRRMVCIQDKLQKASNCFVYFRNHQWTFTNDNVRMVMGRLNEEDRKLFSFDIAEILWQPYMATVWFGIRTYLLQEELSSVASARQKFHKILMASQVCNLFKLLLFWRLLVLSSGVVRHRLCVPSVSFSRRIFETFLSPQWAIKYLDKGCS